MKFRFHYTEHRLYGVTIEAEDRQEAQEVFWGAEYVGEQLLDVTEVEIDSITELT